MALSSRWRHVGRPAVRPCRRARGVRDLGATPDRAAVAVVAVAAVVLLTAVLTAAAPSPAHAQGVRSSYRDGLEAFEGGDWETAVRQMRQAIEERPQEAARLPKLLFRRYTPYFYLGAALAAQGDCRAALAAFSESERQGVIQGFDDYDLLLGTRQTCEARFERAALREHVEKAEEAVERAAASAAEVGQLRAVPELAAVWEWRENSLDKRRQIAEDQLTSARAILREAAGGEPDAAALERAAEVAAQAYWQFEAIRAEASQHLAEVRALVSRQQESLERAEREARSLLASSTPLAGYPGISRGRAELESLLGEVARSSRAPGELERLEARIGHATSVLREAMAPPPEVLRQAATAYLAGDYRQAIELLAGARFPSPRAGAHAALLRAGARFAQARSGAADSGELALAAQDVAECKRLDPLVQPPPAYFSPAFVAFFVGSSGGGGG